MSLSVIHSEAQTVIVKSENTDVFVALVANYKHFGQKRVYLKQQIGKECKITGIGATAQGCIDIVLNPELLPLLHALTGRDSSSCLYIIGKSTAWKIFLSSQELLSRIDFRNPTQSDYQLAEQFL